MRWFRFIVVVLVVTVLQAGVVGIFAVTGSNLKPDLLLILMVFFAVYSGTSDAIIASFAIGLAADLIGSTMGTATISFGFFGSLLAYFHRLIAIRRVPYQLLAIFVVGILAGLFVYLLTFLKGHPTEVRILPSVIGTALYSAIVGPFLFLPLAWWMRIRTSRFSQN